MTLIDLLQQQPVIYLALVGLIGLFVGSFLNVVIHRLPIMMELEWRRGWQQFASDSEGLSADATPDTGQQSEQAASGKGDTNAAGSSTASLETTFNLAVPRSRCPSCGNLIQAWQNIPVLSYMWLGGKCASCDNKISIRYPVVEVFTAILSIICAWKFGVSLQAVAAIFITWSLIALSGIDFDTHLLPDSITLPLMWFGLIASLIPIFAGPTDAIIGAAVGYMSLWLIYWAFKLITGKEGMGYGDFKLLAALGAWFGWQALPMIVLLSSVVGAIVGLTLILAMGRDKQVPMPFGPFLAAAGWLAMIFGERLTSMYAGLYI